MKACAVIETTVPGFGVKKWSKILGSRCARKHAQTIKYLIFYNFICSGCGRDAIFSRFFPA
jgi:hypothetical protein